MEWRYLALCSESPPYRIRQDWDNQPDPEEPKKNLKESSVVIGE